jgi:uncharacterized membrane protein YgcG
LLQPLMIAAQTPPPVPRPVASPQPAVGDAFSTQQLDALLAPIALYPDRLLTQVLIAATFPLQIVEAMRWAERPEHRDLTGDAMTKALEAESWDPSVKSLIPFPQVLSQLNDHLEWTQQLGYAFANQEADVLESVQRLRRQAQGQGHLQSTPQQTVRTEPPPVDASSTAATIVIEPAQPNVVYVPSFDPTVVYGAWPYPAYPPVVAAPAPGYAVGSALLTGLAFGTGVAVTSALWGWSQPNWYRGNVDVNVNHWNNINVNRQRAVSNTWSPTLNRNPQQAAALRRPPPGPVGGPVRAGGLPANAIGRQAVHVPADLVRHPPAARPGPIGPGSRPNLSPGSRPDVNLPNRPTGAQGRPPLPPGVGDRARPNAAPPRPAGQPPQRLQNVQRRDQGAFAGMRDGNRATAFQQRGAQSRDFGGNRPAGTIRSGGGGFQGGGGARGDFHGRR